MTPAGTPPNPKTALSIRSRSPSSSVVAGNIFIATCSRPTTRSVSARTPSFVAASSRRRETSLLRVRTVYPRTETTRIRTSRSPCVPWTLRSAFISSSVAVGGVEAASPLPGAGLRVCVLAGGYRWASSPGWTFTCSRYSSDVYPLDPNHPPDLVGPAARRSRESGTTSASRRRASSLPPARRASPHRWTSPLASYDGRRSDTPPFTSQLVKAAQVN